MMCEEQAAIKPGKKVAWRINSSVYVENKQIVRKASECITDANVVVLVMKLVCPR